MTGDRDIYCGGTAMCTSLGNEAETIEKIMRGESGLKYDEGLGMYAGRCGAGEREGCTRFESAVIGVVEEVTERSGISVADEEVQLVISTTKGNVELIEGKGRQEVPERAMLWASAKVIARHCGAANEPVVISNACISGVSALVVAREMLLAGRCRHAVVAGCDVLSTFITEGFASFKSISAKLCRPYDAGRDGLTLGEACGAIVLTTNKERATKPLVRLTGGAITNDANHISGPSRTGDGLYHAIDGAMKEAGVEAGDIGFVNAHGTATLYNDDMESKAMAWAGLDGVPLNSVKGYVGHTLGASGVIETILCIDEMRGGRIAGTKGFAESGTTHRLAVAAEGQDIGQRRCVKTASGFGGCNAAVVLDMEDKARQEAVATGRKAGVVARYRLPQTEEEFATFVRAEYKRVCEPNMKFYKMSDMSKALYVAVEALLSAAGGMEDVSPRRRSIVLANSTASMDADIVHQEILDRYLPEGASPAAFVYTLANVSAGEICIRHKIQGDNTFFVEERETGLAEWYAGRLIETDKADRVICGWCDYMNGKWNVDIKLIQNIG